MTLEDIVAITKPYNDKIIAEGRANKAERALNEAWAKINALGGTVVEYDDFGKGINYAVEQALNILEELGARDPLTQNGQPNDK